MKLIPATAGIVVLAYNLKGLNGVLKLPRDVYVGIFAGDIKKWNDPKIQQANPDLNLPAMNIILVARADGSGTTYAFTNHLSAISEDWRDRGPGVGKTVKWPPHTMLARWNEGVAGRIKITDGPSATWNTAMPSSVDWPWLSWRIKPENLSSPPPVRPGHSDQYPE